MNRGGGIGERGVIYVMANKSIDGMVKIGRTARDSWERARELSKPSGVPTAFEVIYDQIVADAAGVEKLVHDILAQRRVNPQREFFRVSQYEAIKTVQAAAENLRPAQEEASIEREILPALEGVMRRWLRREIVSVKFLQYSDLCALRIASQPDPTVPAAVETVFDLEIFAEEGTDRDLGDGRLFSPLRPIEENIRLLVEELDPYSVIMVGIPLLAGDVENYVADLRDRQGIEPPLRPEWRITEKVWQMLGPEEEWRAIAAELGLLDASNAMVAGSNPAAGTCRTAT